MSSRKKLSSSNVASADRLRRRRKTVCILYVSNSSAMESAGGYGLFSYDYLCD